MSGIYKAPRPGYVRCRLLYIGYYMMNQCMLVEKRLFCILLAAVGSTMGENERAG